MRVWCTYSIKRDAVLLQDGGRDKGHLVTKKGITSLRAAGEKACKEDKKIYLFNFIYLFIFLCTINFSFKMIYSGFLLFWFYIKRTYNI